MNSLTFNILSKKIQKIELHKTNTALTDTDGRSHGQRTDGSLANETSSVRGRKCRGEFVEGWVRGGNVWG